MPENINVNLFPDSAEEAVAMLYAQNQNLAGKTPAEIYTIYLEAYYEILKDKKEKRDTGWFKEKK